MVSEEQNIAKGSQKGTMIFSVDQFDNVCKSTLVVEFASPVSFASPLNKSVCMGILDLYRCM